MRRRVQRNWRNWKESIIIIIIITRYVITLLLHNYNIALPAIFLARLTTILHLFYICKTRCDSLRCDPLRYVFTRPESLGRQDRTATLINFIIERSISGWMPHQRPAQIRSNGGPPVRIILIGLRA